VSYKFNKLYDYPKSMRSLINNKRHYEVGEEKLPSVTTILSACQSDEKKESLARWKAKMGDRAADKVRDDAAERGTAMHKYLEAHIDGTGLKDLTPLGVQAETMAHKIIESGLRDLSEVWGQEVTLYYPGLYAGATDVVGIFDGQPTIIDFKQSNKPKRREWIEDYFEQLGAYCMAHNYVYGTKIQSGVILMCTKDFMFQKFEVSGREFVRYQHAFLKKVDQYHQNCTQAKDGQDTKNDQKV
jgi:hypothetical protein